MTGAPACWCGCSSFLGAAIDEARNADAAADADISVSPAAVRTLVIAAREDIEIARQVRTAVGLAVAMGGLCFAAHRRGAEAAMCALGGDVAVWLGDSLRTSHLWQLLREA